MTKAIPWLIFFIIYVVIANVFSPYPRGSDQYWNVGNVDRVINVDGQYKTNNIYPASLPKINEELPRPWVQNRPVVYIVTAFAFLLKHAHQTWIIVNSIFLFLSAMLLYKILKRENAVNAKMLTIITCLFILFPMNFYLVMQALPEIFNQFLVIAITYLLLCKPHNYINIAAVSLLTGLLIFQRDSYVLLIAFIPVYLLYFPTKAKKIFPVMLFLAITAILFLLKPLLLPSHTIQPLSFLHVITKERYGQSTMSSYLYANLPPQSFSENLQTVSKRAVHAFTSQFSISKSISIFFYLINLLLIPYLILLFKIRRLSIYQKKGLCLISIFVLTHFITVTLFQNQYRFAAILVPLLMCCSYWALQSNTKYLHITRTFLIALIPLFGLINIFLGIRNRQESFNEHALVLQVKEIKKTRINNQPVFIDFTAEQPWLIGYALSPNLCYYFPGDTEISELIAASQRLKTNLFVIKKNTDFYSTVENNIITEEMIDKQRNIVLATISLETP